MSQQDDGKPQGGDRRGAWPLSVRVLAVFFVLSYVVQPVAFLGLTGTAAFLYGLGHPLDWLLLGLAAGGIVVVVACSVFRRWFVAWGRRSYPEGKPE